MKIKIFVWLLPLCVLFFLNSAFSQSSTLSFTSIPSTTEIPSPGRGAEQWHSEASSQVIGNVTEGVTPVMLDAYVRSFLTWDNMEPSQGVYNWTNFDVAMNDAISKGRKLSFSIMALFPGYNGGVSANGVGMAYPLYLHNLMQSEGGNNTDWISPQNPSWVPNYNSPNWQARQAAFLNALAAHINTASSGGKNYRDALGVVSIGLMGSWAEWNFSNIVGNVATEFPAGRVPTFAAGKALIDAYINAFPNNPLVIPHAAFDRHQLQNVWTDPQTGWYALTASNKWGKIGITRMNWGLTEGYISAWAEDNVFTYNGLRFDTAIMNRYKYAPLTGEVAGYNAAVGGAPFWDLPRQVTFYHASSFGNGNYYGEQNISLQGRDNIRAAWRASGYRLVLETGTITSSLSGGMPFAVSLNWKNLGVAPAYENWNVTYELRNASNVAVWSGTSSFTPKFFLPSTTATTVTDNFTLPATIAQGNYSMVLIVRDPTGYRQPLPLAINGRNADGSYLLKSITVGASTGIQPPVANAGTAQTVTLPVNSISLQGSGTPAAGQTISAYAWTLVSGPNVPALTGASSSALTITGSSVVAGNYTYKLTVTQSNSATATSNVNITVNSTVTTPPPPVTPGVTTTIFTAQLPSNPLYNDGQGIELGVKFRSSATGYVTGVRFYKIAGDGGTHTGELYSSAGTRLAQAVFSSESASGWQQVLFSTPIAVTAGTTYIAAYHSSAGNYAATNNFFTADIVNGVISGLADGKDGVNGLYNYSSSPVFPTTSNGQKPNYWVDAMFTANAVVNPVPTVTANAGANQTITLPTSTVTLDGSKSTGTINSYTWTKVSGPNAPSIAGNSVVAATDTVNLVLIQGESNAAGMALNTQATLSELLPRNNLKIINNNTLQFESLQLGLNNNLLANIGSLLTHGLENGLANAVDAGKLSQPTYLVKAGGSGSWISEWLSNGSSRNPGEYSWAQLIGRMDAAVNYLKSKGIPYKITVWQSIGINDYNAGTTNATYQSQMQQFRTDLRSRYGQNIPFLTTHFFASHPYNAVIDAIAASDPLKISSAIDITGATYKDPNVHWDHDGLILIANRMIDKMATSTAVTPPSSSATSVVTGLVQGVYVFQLAVNGGASTSQVSVTVNPIATAAVANAGSNQTITLPASTVTLNGTGSTGAISSYAWTNISGPNTPAFAAASSSNTSVSGLVQGVYVFKLSINGGASSSQVTVTVNAAAATVSANAGANQTITLPASTVTLNGTGSTGTISSYAWTKVSGPNTAAIAAASASSTAVSGLVQGVYVFQLSVNGGASSSQVTVTVNAAAAIVTANAGANQTITLPTSIVTLNGTGSTGTISSYAWTKVSGPGTVVLASASASSTAVSGLVQGVYVFQLAVNGGASVSQVSITVNPLVASVSANAGNNQVIVLPASSVTLSGSASTGIITSYAWTKVSGPNNPTISNPSSATTAVRQLIQGTYVFSLSVNGGASVSKVTVNVNAVVVATTIFTTQAPVNLYKDGKGVELGVKFRSSASGYVTGVRFYKLSGDAGTHTGELYSSTGTRLAQAVFTSEGTSGWQQVLFSTPVAVSAGTTYVAAYHSSAGNYAATNNYYTASVVNGALTGLADGVDGVNGVYNYSSTPVFPNISNGQKPNYWVDVLFVSNSSSALAGASSGNVVSNDTQTDFSGTGKNNYQLDQNYPNPASQSTRINYYIAESVRVELILTDVLGTQTKLVSEVQTAGAHSYTLNVSSLRKGIYFYKIQAGKFTATKSLIVQ